MPGRNLEKIYIEDGYYHVYNRGANKQIIFPEDEDYVVFLSLLKRYLSIKPMKDKKGREYPSYSSEVELLAYCLMPNHFHLLVYQQTPDGMTKLIKSLSTTYSMYFNKKYKRNGGLFQNRFKASLISNDEYLHHISRYIHLNPRNYKTWRFSSLPYYRGKQNADWIKSDKILSLFSNSVEYMGFLAEYEDYKESLDQIKHELADS